MAEFPAQSVTLLYWSCLCPIRIEANSKGIYRIDLLIEKGADEKEKEVDKQIEALECSPDIKINLKSCVNWLAKYFEGDFSFLNKKETFPVLDRSHEGQFASKVWKCLERILPGQTISYGEVATLTGSEGAARAVGQVMKNNKLSLILPCHRVIRSDGSLGHYSSGGTTIKQWLLQHESNH
ncbi:PREDICTED: methylated-DNA--protein-cysteine methyltransferase-like [Amphimedon queenslandica]|uniref:Methylated-DNA--protein-cysteine methyltransferase n=1 Tax=Amphimedon queenslandica TaxID=400682 RepID=A0A1X7U2V4_AMPQE|nr:PREDICTED: methylated-DNA--protein-cysteine methyltransferase-like [Amphimedon queenslandica]|eukprot:XP_011406174.1 PREDICTED: methylated-DNA--protein-cysteine methyltransferase-like [Amphimedon queenslandica]